jgi:putative methyltransferase (TIGR04325 family)
MAGVQTRRTWSFDDMGTGLIAPFIKAYRRLAPARQSAPGDDAINWSGDYNSFDAALAACGDDRGYSGNAAVDRYVKRYREVIAAPWAQTSDNQHVIRYLAALSAARPIDGVIRVLDFGGGYGSLYEILRWLYPDLRFDWTIVELPALVARGAEMGASVEKHFASEIPAGRFSLVIASGALHYLPDPAATFARLVAIESPAHFIGRVPIAPLLSVDRLTVQTVPASLFAARFPCWIFSEGWNARIRAAGNRVMEWDSPGDIFPLGAQTVQGRAFLLLK